MATPDPADPRGLKIILYYKYCRVDAVEDEAKSQAEFCHARGLNGRILLAGGNEGINGTLAGTEAAIGEYMEMMEAHPTFQMKVADFKTSWSGPDCLAPFPDLSVKVSQEIVSTGRAFAEIAVEETSKGYLTPEEFHAAVLEHNSGDKGTVLIDVRNHKEFAIGHFEGSTDPETRTFTEFPKWVDDNVSSLGGGKKVLMYCTGGIRCEKASAYVRRALEGREGKEPEVYHLKGGIHKYLERFGAQGLFKGKNYVFDRRGAMGPGPGTPADGLPVPEGEGAPVEEGEVVGKCVMPFCGAPWDEFKPDAVCAVCREPVLCCESCRGGLDPKEFHCNAHIHLRRCYYADLTPFSEEALKGQVQELREHLAALPAGKALKNRRRMIFTQMSRVEEALDGGGRGGDVAPMPDGVGGAASGGCRNCGSAECPGNCWGFYGLQALQRMLKRKQREEVGGPRRSNSGVKVKEGEVDPRVELSKEKEKEAVAAVRARVAAEQLRIRAPVSSHVDPATGLRRPPPVHRALCAKAKGRRAGISIADFVAHEFGEAQSPREPLSPSGLAALCAAGAVVVNGAPAKDPGGLMATGDVVEHYVHWHEPAVTVAGHSASKGGLALREEEVQVGGRSTNLLVCDKPASVPVYPAGGGGYLLNTLTVLAEAQLGLPPRTLAHVHQLDTAASGLVLLAPGAGVGAEGSGGEGAALARALGAAVDSGDCRKTYLARTRGKFPSTAVEAGGVAAAQDLVHGARVHGKGGGGWSRKGEIWSRWVWTPDGVEITCPIEANKDPRGPRAPGPAGKLACTAIKRRWYDPARDESLVECLPQGARRAHQVRVHLMHMGFPIANDITYSGGANAPAREVLPPLPPSTAAAGAEGGAAGAEVEAAVRAHCRLCRAEAWEAAPEAIWLHALSYEIQIGGEAVKLEVPAPAWADPPPQGAA